MSTSRGWSIARWIFLGAACAVMFLLPSAALIDRGAPRWLAGVLGVLSFPLAPGAWHVLAERARRRRIAALKVAPKATLTVGDRFFLRLFAVALLTCAPWFVIARGRTWRALWHHGSWVVDWIGSSGSSDARGGGGVSLFGKPLGPIHVDADRRLLDSIPADAEAIVWIRSAKDLGKVLGGDAEEPAASAPDKAAETAETAETAEKKGDDGFEQGVLAFKKGEVLGVVRAKKIDDLKPDAIDQDAAKKWFGHELHFVQHRLSDDTVVIVSEGWDAAYLDRAAGRAPAAKALIDRLGPAPADALIVAVAIPRETIADLTLRDAIAWLRVDVAKQELVASATVRGADGAAAATFATSLQHELGRLKDRLPGSCTESAGALLDGIHLTTKGDTVSIDTHVAPRQIMAAMFCGLGAEK